ncbi:MAG: hypothetical protein JSV84_04185 [Gemmatimonadota bacterium]|nr:MAG: hypothetical protein JSV84_04185 [Gemmatimonadota bacterium]
MLFHYSTFPGSNYLLLYKSHMQTSSVDNAYFYQVSYRRRILSIAEKYPQRKYTIVMPWLFNALKPEPLDRQANTATVFSVSESPALAGDEFGKNSVVSRCRSRRRLWAGFSFCSFSLASKEKEDE